MNMTVKYGALARTARDFGQALRCLASDIGRGYAWVALLPHAGAGTLLAAITVLDNPYRAAHGLTGALAAWLGARCAGADAAQRPVAVFNGLLLGLLMGCAGLLPSGGWMLLLVACAFTGGITVMAGAAILQRTGLGLLSAPFALMAIALQGTITVASVPAAHDSTAALLGSLISLPAHVSGVLFFLRTEWAGWAVLLVIALASRYYLLLMLMALAISGTIAFTVPSATASLLISAHANAVLTMLLVGGLLSAPCITSALCASAAAALAAMLTWVLGLAVTWPVYSLPFVVASWVALWSMRRHPALQSLLHALPVLPEEASIQRTMAASHPAYRAMPSLAVPFNDIWTVSQDSDGPHTHVGALRYALDFIRVIDGRSFRGLGATPADFYAFDQPVFAPASGEVVIAVSHIPDNPIGAVDAVNRWGNHVVIRMENGLYVLLAHLRMGSILVSAGAIVHQGQAIGCCGNSGRSPQPHLHLHVQTTPFPGSPTTPFALTNLWLHAGQPGAHHVLQAVPVTGQLIGGAGLPAVFPLALMPGRGLRYRARRGEKEAGTWSLECTLTADGSWQLLSSAGATCFVAQRDGMFFCSGRNTACDDFFDAWIMACTNTSTSPDVSHWTHQNQRASDSVSRPHRLWATLAIASVSVLQSSGKRWWQESAQCWVQSATHRQALTGQKVLTQVRISPQLGAAEVCVKWGSKRCTLTAVALFQRPDIGIPGWDRAVGTGA